MLGGILAFLSGRGSFCAHGRKVVRAGGAWEGGGEGRAGRRKGVWIGAQVQQFGVSDVLTNDPGTEKRKSKEKMNWITALAWMHLIFAVESNGLMGCGAGWPARGGQSTEEMGGARDGQFSGWGTIFGLLWDGGFGAWKGSAHNLLYLWTLIMFHAKTRLVAWEFTWIQGKAKWDKQ